MKTAAGRKFVTNTPHSSIDGKKKVVCPLCLYQCVEIPMVFDTGIKCWLCNRCKYVMPHHLDPVETRVLSAGNDEVISKPYGRSVTFHEVKKNKIRPDKYNNPMTAWQDD